MTNYKYAIVKILDSDILRIVDEYNSYELCLNQFIIYQNNNQNVLLLELRKDGRE